MELDDFVLDADRVDVWDAVSDADDDLVTEVVRVIEFVNVVVADEEGVLVVLVLAALVVVEDAELDEVDGIEMETLAVELAVEDSNTVVVLLAD